MRHASFVNLVLLIVVAFWGSGAARALHERLEHSPSAIHAAVQQSDERATSAGLGVVPVKQGHGHHEACETCAALAAMAAVCGVLILFSACLGDAAVARSFAVVQRLHAVCLLPDVSNRGPPRFASAARFAF